MDGERRYLRLQTNYIANSVALVSHGSTGLADRVHKLHAQCPLIDSQFDFSGKIVDVLDE